MECLQIHILIEIAKKWIGMEDFCEKNLWKNAFLVSCGHIDCYFINKGLLFQCFLWNFLQLLGRLLYRTFLDSFYLCSKTCKEQNDSYLLTAKMLQHLCCPGIQIYNNGWFKSKTARRNRYSYMGFGFINSVLNILSLISGGRCSYRKRPVKYLAKLTSTVSKTKKKFVFKLQHLILLSIKIPIQTFF